MNLAQLFADSFAAGDPGRIAPALLHRVQMADGWALAIGRDALIARWMAIVAAFEDRSATLLAEAADENNSAFGLRLAGRLCAGPGPLAHAFIAPDGEAPLVALPCHFWVRLEAGRAVAVEAVIDWWGLALAAGLDPLPLADALGTASPCHRPLGELASGRGQLADEGSDDISRFNARRLAREPALLRLAADLPDARLTADCALPNALLCRLMGHADGRRVSLPMSRLGDSPWLWDRLALAASARRPFWPE